jgi:hypothetical protein
MQRVDGGDVLATPGRRRGFDELQRGETVSETWLPSSLFSRGERMERLEIGGTVMYFG